MLHIDSRRPPLPHHHLQGGHSKAWWGGFCRASDLSPQSMFILILFQIHQWETRPQSLGFTGRTEQFVFIRGVLLGQLLFILIHRNEIYLSR